MTTSGTGVFHVEFDQAAADEIDHLRAYERTSVLAAIREQLTTEPHVETRNRRALVPEAVPWEQLGPVWELRVGALRVFYDLVEQERLVVVRATRRKGRKRTKEIL